MLSLNSTAGNVTALFVLFFIYSTCFIWDAIKDYSPVPADEMTMTVLTLLFASFLLSIMTLAIWNLLFYKAPPSR
ncbi:hypothetical protein [Pantoea vagans]|uniref:hypothetical protein n=1 Tax=Pantoea vagans TaxID=470934 RepID=UPI0023B072A4|nr:hypothetical protein [Pantoea vagans]MDE8558905.1 hypothetical protein [Pantoea vagans]MDE8578910.1 hypothetical protein [Pantoea vagans]